MHALQWGKVLCFYSEKNVVVGGRGDTRSDNAVMMVSLLPEVCLQQEQDNVLPVGSHFQCCRV